MEQSETQAIKKELKKQGYTVISCTFGSGTARNWIHTTVLYPEDAPPMTYPVERYPGQIDQMYTSEYCEFSRKVAWEAQKAAGRGHLQDDISTDLFMVNMITDVISRERYESDKAWKQEQKDKLKERKTCKDCGAMGKYAHRNDGYYKIYVCPECGKQWRA